MWANHWLSALQSLGRPLLATVLGAIETRWQDGEWHIDVTLAEDSDRCAIHLFFSDSSLWGVGGCKEPRS